MDAVFRYLYYITFFAKKVNALEMFTSNAQFKSSNPIATLSLKLYVRPDFYHECSPACSILKILIDICLL